jgi:bacteriorhodopsin
MLMLKRLAVWLIETLVQVPLLMALLMLLTEPSSDDRWFNVRLTLFAVNVFMLGSGYPITTGIVAILFRGRIRWLYPTIAALLFVVHEQFFLTGWAPPEPIHIQIQASGASLVFATTFLGGKYLQRWSETARNS